MPINRPLLDDRGYNEIVAVVVIIISFVLTFAYPDVIPIATYVIQPGSSALRDATIPISRSVVNAVVWGILSYSTIRVSERLRHKGR